MTEAFIRAKVLKELEAEGYVCWFPYSPRFKYAKQKDIFGVFDVIATRRYGLRAKPSNEVRQSLRWIQFSDYTNVSHRREKVIHELRTKRFFPLGSKEIWGYKKGTSTFRKVEITYQDVFPTS